MQFVETGIAHCYRVLPTFRSDHRGMFGRIYCADVFREHGLPLMTAQSNLAVTRFAGTVRGLHWQAEPHAEAKLVRCVRGAIYDVAVEMRAGSPTERSVVGVELSAHNREALLVPEGVAHGYQALTDDVEVIYHVSAPYAPDAERGVRPTDPALAIRWPLPVAHLSDKDRGWPLLADGG